MDIDNFISLLKQGKILKERDVKNLCIKVIEIFAEESNVQPISSPVTVCGDIHGQFFDLLELFQIGGEIPDQKYIFIGDFVDRGYNSVETFEYLLCLKLKYPDKICLLRGNHESRQITSMYGFYDEIVKKYGNANPWKFFTEAFGFFILIKDYLPIAAIIENEVLCVHGGLSPEIKTIEQIRLIERNVEIPHDGPFADMMWSDPDDILNWRTSPRGAGWLFGCKVVSEFNYLNDLKLICRAHQLVQEGYKYWFPEENLITVWSSPNYCYRCGNVAAILKFDDQMQTKISIFNSVLESAKSVNPKMVLPYFL